MSSLPRPSKAPPTQGSAPTAARLTQTGAKGARAQALAHGPLRAGPALTCLPRALEHLRRCRCKALARPWPCRATMDVSPASPEPFLAAPQAELLEELLQAQLGPLPRLAAICRLKRLPSGGYSTTDDLHLVLERRRLANAKERERVRVQGHLTPTAMSAGAQGSRRLCMPSLPLLGDFVFARLGPGPQWPCSTAPTCSNVLSPMGVAVSPADPPG